MKFLILLLSSQFATAAPVRSNEITGFRYASCQNASCIVLQAPKAYMGMQLDVFSTSGLTLLEITDRAGKLRSKYVGTSAMLNSQLQTIVFENDKSGFLLYSLKDGQISDYTGGSK